MESTRTAEMFVKKKRTATAADGGSVGHCRGRSHFLHKLQL